MWQLRRFRMGLVAAATGAALCSGMQAAPAHADGWMCAASAARATVAGQATAEPATAGGDAAPCRADAAELSSPALPTGISTGALSARTATDVRTPSQASAAVHDLTLGVPSNLLPTPGTAQIDAIPPVDVPLPVLGTVSVDLRPALRELLRPLPSVELLRLGSATASATGRCVAGDAVIAGSSFTSGAVLAGRPVDLGGPLSESVELLGGYAIDPSDIDPAKVVQLESGLAPAVLRPFLQPVLDTMAPIAVPATLADVQLLPDERVQDGSRRTYRALHVRASVGGAEIVDAVLAEATVGGDACAAGSGTPGAESVADLALQCASQQVVLIDVLDTGRRVKLVGAAAGRYVGRTVEIRLTATGAVVARPIVREDGTFQATAPLPARRIRKTNAARYRASIDRERSLPLKLRRRMIVTRTASTARGTTMHGRVTGPLARRARITVKRRVACGRWTVVKRFAMPRNGRFRVTIPHARGATSAVFRMQTTVGALDRPSRPKPTFTLPRYVTSR
jgi:hypothetical protein